VYRVKIYKEVHNIIKCLSLAVALL